MILTPQVLLIGASAIGALVIHATVFGLVAGKLMNRVTQVEKQQNADHGRYITKEQCDGVNAIWEEKLKGMMDITALRDAQNAKEHKTLLEVATKTNESIDKLNLAFVAIQKSEELG